MTREFHGFLILSGGTAEMACDAAVTARMQGADVAKGREELLSGKHGKEAQQFVREMASMRRMSPAEWQMRLRELEAHQGGK